MPIPSSPSHTPVDLSSSLTLLLAIGAGLSVAALYYCQPLLGALAADLGRSGPAVGLVPTLTQLGYALGILTLAPLGDRYDRRRIILAKAAALAGALLVTASARALGPLLVGSFAIGVTATLAQDLVPAAAILAPPERRGRAVGAVMTGLLLGILLSRVVSGFVAQQLGWRAMFALAAVSVGLLGVALRQGLPRFAPTTTLGYGALLRSLVALWTRHAALRRAALAQGLLSVAFSAFWSTLAVMLHDPPLRLGSTVAGAFGLAGAAGALVAPVAGRAADRQGPERVTRLGAALSALSFAAMLALPVLGTTASLVLLAASAVVFDLGVQASLIAHQTLVYGLEPEARSRLNALLLVAMFVGMASGSALGAQLYARWGWTAVTALAVAASLGALAVRALGVRHPLRV